MAWCAVAYVVILVYLLSSSVFFIHIKSNCIILFKAQGPYSDGGTCHLKIKWPKVFITGIKLTKMMRYL